MSIVDELVANLGFGFGDCLRVISTAPARYHVFTIPKRTGGARIIAHPARELKAMQRYLLESKLCRFPTHSSAMAYKKDVNIYQNAVEHIRSNCILNMDFKEFFPSIVPSDWVSFAKRQKMIAIPAEDIAIYSQILFWGKTKNNTSPVCLSIGAPSSPMMSNILMFAFDEQMKTIADIFEITYTRYADDITLSASKPNVLIAAEKRVRSLIRKQKTPKLLLKEEKRGLYTKGGRRSVTGLILTPERNISIGRNRKRDISSMLYHLRKGDLSDDDRAKLKGLLGFVIAVEKSFIDQMRIKYGSTTIDEALKYYIPAKSA